MSDHGIENTSYTPAGRYLLEIAYDGSEYSGWQIQPHCLAVQQVVQENLTKLFQGPEIHLIGSSRTDAGVHAMRFAASFLYPAIPAIPMAKLPVILNRRFPKNIRIRSIREVPLSFHSRYDAMGKAYTYVFNLGEETPFNSRYAWHVMRKFSVDKLKDAANILVGTHDFSSFVVERSMIDEAVRTIFRIEVNQEKQFCCVTFIGNGFLYKMIRCMIGTLEAAAAGILSTDDVKKILFAKKRECAPETAPACGLYLMKVFFNSGDLASYHYDGLPFLQ